ncbi:MAG: hypothetical protein R3272_17305 [Candidatus Promineifilaceae bacterium]|nr:hypothetical protein [Candidatus Promineifilaceae bacterium]
MKRNRVIVSALLVVVLTLALASTALASKQLYKARLSPLPGVDSPGRGSAVVSEQPGSIEYVVGVVRLVGVPTEVHLVSSGGVHMATLCSATCDDDYDASRDMYRIEGALTASNTHVPPGDLIDALRAGQVEVVVFTTAFAGGEVSGLLVPQ